ncbi:MAG: alanine--tRNA ligase [Candidatus Nealsonbacteria bacterium]|nr:MAG: alanine--tRNA ligase [Candidatus Nealsonbacteria bacterium]
MISKEIRKKFLNFFRKKGHKIVPSSSLLPEDTTVLFTTAGMQQFTLYLQGEKDPIVDFGRRHLASCQKCFRTDDIDKVGDDTHHTFFEMLGNWSIGQDAEKGYFKEGAVKYALEFFVDVLGLDKNRLWTTVFKGEKNIPKDEELKRIWQENRIPEERIREFGIKDNFWGPVGKRGPCGPCSEIFYDRGESFGCGAVECGPNCGNCKRFVELWNLVFMEYFKDEDGSYKLLSQKNVDTGVGFERLAALLQHKSSAYETDLFLPVIQELERISSKKYEELKELKEEKRIFRILADHIRSIVFLTADGVLPSNVEQGYILRRILRRAIRFGKVLNLPNNFLVPLAKKVIEIYKDVYPEVKSKQTDSLTVIQREEERFEKTLKKGLKQFKKISSKGNISGSDAFHLYDTYGFPLELSEELAKEKGIKVDKKGFKEEFKKHQEISRAGVEKKFGGIGKEATYTATKLHTATHLLHQALRNVLGFHVKQMGSDITPQRLRFDFSHPQKLTDKELKRVQDLVNQKIKEDLEVIKEELPYQTAVKSGALAFFKDKYPDRVTVYSIRESGGKIFSKEICAGPHENSTGELGHFKIVKEESAGAGIRRIRAILE